MRNICPGPVRRFKNNLDAFHDAALVDDRILTFIIDRNTGSCFTSCIASTTTQPIAIDQRSPEFVDNTKSLVGLHYKHLFFFLLNANIIICSARIMSSYW